ncbi:vesicle fusion protein, variant [Capsaspora owczarzaki ATCC 30864]|nr:vesicle fusion protein, variant [Capsaspora owczarzaki ATCC 30864]
MHDAFQVRAVVEKLPLAIEAVTTWGDKIILSTDKTPLLVYSVPGLDPNGNVIPGADTTPQLLESKKAFSKRPASQLTVIEELNLLVSLSDGMVSVHDLPHFSPRFSLAKTRGASLYALDVQTPEVLPSTRPSSSRGQQQQQQAQAQQQLRVRLCVVVKKKIITFLWEGGTFVEDKELNTPDVARAVAWCEHSLCVGFKKEYNLIHIDSGALTDLFPTGKSGEPLIARVSNKELLLQKDLISIFIGYDGKPTRRFGISWSDTPTYLDLVPPYAVALLPRGLEVRTLETQIQVQTLDLPKVQFIAQGRGVFAASPTHVWHLMSMPLQSQIEQLIQQKEYEEALNLAQLLKDVSEERKQAQVRQIRTLHAYSLFDQHKYDESLVIFTELDMDPPQVIGLYPELLPEELRRQMKYPIALPKFERGELEKAKLALIEFLTQKRNRLIKAAADPSAQDEMTRKEVSQIIDTTLLKCYLDTNAALVGPLLRVENYCHVGESEKILKRSERYAELVMLYQGKGLHRKALELLFREAQNPASALRGHMRTVNYLQKLGAEHLDLILEFSRWVLLLAPEDGLRIFTEDMKEIETLPHDKILTHLEGFETILERQAVSSGFQESRLVLPYLEHVIDNWHATATDFHNKRVLLYLTAVQALRKDTEPRSNQPAGTEAGALGMYRRKLIAFLETSRNYKPPIMLSRFPTDDLYEERALLLGRLNRHEQALNIYVTKLNNTFMAEQ